MDPKDSVRLVEQALATLSKDELVNLILDRVRGKNTEHTLPVSIFWCDLSPLEAVCRYLKDQGFANKDLATLLHKHPSSISEALKNASTKSFTVAQTEHSIPLSALSKHKQLSILEIVVLALTEQGMKLSAIAKLLRRSPKTIWTIRSRAKKKLGQGGVEMKSQSRGETS